MHYALGIALVLVVLVGIMALVYVDRLHRQAVQTRTSAASIDLLHHVLSLTTDAETASRGFTITGDTTYIAPFDDATRRLPSELRRLRSILADEPAQGARLDTLAPLIADRLAISGELIAVRRVTGFEAARRLTATGAGKALHDRIRELVARMVAAEQAHLARHAQATERSLTQTRVALLFGSVTAFVLLLLASLFVRQAFAVARTARDHLEAEVEERTTALRGSEERYRTLVSSMDDGVFVASEERFVFANVAMARMLGYELDQFTGLQFPDVIDPEFLATWVERYRQRVAEGPEPLQFYEVRLLRRDGTAVWVELRANRVLFDGRRSVLGIVRDITERKEAERALLERSEDLARSNADLEQFAYVASHDLQEPLRAVAGSVQLLQRRYRDQLDQAALEYIGHAVDGSVRMQQLIDDLLAFSRVGTRGETLAPASAGQALDRALHNLSVAIQESGAVVTQGPLPTLPADAAQLSSLFQNLISNAIKFRGPRPPRIHVGATREGDVWTFTVSDNGIGIESRYFARIFGVFQRLHTRREYAGTGIGLAICRKIVERHGGRIWLDSVPGSGTTFSFTLPAL